jgi:hypothetical protein
VCARSNSFIVAKWIYTKSIELGKSINFNVDDGILMRLMIQNPKISIDNMEWLCNMAYLNEQPFEFHIYGTYWMNLIINQKGMRYPDDKRKIEWLFDKINMATSQIDYTELYGIEPLLIDYLETDVFMCQFED